MACELVSAALAGLTRNSPCRLIWRLKEEMLGEAGYCCCQQSS